MRRLEFLILGLTKDDFCRLRLNHLLRARSSAFLWVILTAGVLYLFGHTGTRGANPFIQNGDFEDVRIGPPFQSSNLTDVPGWTHSGSSGDGILWRIGNADSSGAIGRAGHGSQFVTLGGGYPAAGSASWRTTIHGLVPGGLYKLSFMLSNENLSPNNEPLSIIVSFPSGSSASPQSYTVNWTAQRYWTVWETKTRTFKATAPAAVLEFSVSNQRYDIGLDDVQVTKY